MPGASRGHGTGSPAFDRQRHDARPGRQRVVFLLVHRRPGADLGRCLVDRQREHGRRLELAGRRAADVAPPPRDQVLRQRLEDPRLLLGVVHRPGRAEDDGRAVVHRVVERGPGQDQAVDQRDGDADLDPSGHGLEHPAAGRAVHVEPIAHPHVEGRDHERPPVGDEAHVADQRLVEDRMDQRAVVGAARGEAAHGRPVGARDLVHRRLSSPWLGLGLDRDGDPSS